MLDIKHPSLFLRVGRDITQQGFNDIIIKNIRAYWKGAGVRVRNKKIGLDIVATGQPAHTMIVIRSNLLNGLPPNGVRK